MVVPSPAHACVARFIGSGLDSVISMHAGFLCFAMQSCSRPELRQNI